MIVDASAIVAILHEEPLASSVLWALGTGDEIKMSAATYLELSTVIAHRRNQRLVDHLVELLRRFQIAIIPFTLEQAVIGRLAYQAYGRGSGHKAGLNFGDCFSYALAAELGEPLLCIGNDFVHTDIALVPLDSPSN